MNKYCLKLSTIALGIALLSSMAALGQSQDRQRRKPPTFEQLLEKMDANEDGKLSEDEVKGPLKDNFAEIDTDENGFITEEEFDNAPKPKGRKRD